MNRTTHGWWLVPLAVLVFHTQVCGDPVLPVGRTEFEIVYDRIARQEALEGGRFDYQIGPYGINGGRFSFGPFSYLYESDSSTLSLFGFIEEDFSAARQERSRAFEGIRGGFAGSPLKQVFVYGNFLLDERTAEDPAYTGKKWRGLAGGVEEAFAFVQTGPVKLWVGRFGSFWGPRNSLVLGSTNALDGFGYTWRWGSLALSYRLARLDRLRVGEEMENRYFAAHRLDIDLLHNLRIGVFESVVFGGEGRTVDLFYLNPLLSFHVAQLNDDVNDNTFVGCDFSYVPVRGFRLFGQVLIDDFQIEKESQGDQEPDQYGVIIGADFADVMHSVDIRVEYSRVSNWTFNQGFARNRYVFEGDPIGGAGGNDYDITNLVITRWLGEFSSVSLEGLYRRQGEGRIDAPWTEPWLDIEGDYDEPFPTGTVERTVQVSLRLRGLVLDRVFLQMGGGYRFAKNAGNAHGVDHELPFVTLFASTFFDFPVTIK